MGKNNENINTINKPKPHFNSCVNVKPNPRPISQPFKKPRDIYEEYQLKIVERVLKVKQATNESVRNVGDRLEHLRELYVEAIRKSKTRLHDDKLLFIKQAIRSLIPPIRWRLPTQYYDYKEFQDVFVDALFIETDLAKGKIEEDRSVTYDKRLNTTFSNHIPRNFDFNDFINDEDYNALELKPQRLNHAKRMIKRQTRGNSQKLTLSAFKMTI